MFDQDMNIQSPAKNSGINIQDWLTLILKNWYWFVLSVLLCVSVAFFNLKKTPEVYSRMATVLIKDGSTKGNMSEAAAFEDLKMLNVSGSIDNEIFVFKSNQLLTNVIKRLKLNISYQVKDGLRTRELYTESPVVVEFVDDNDFESFFLQITPLSEKQCEISFFTDQSNTETVTYNDTIKTSAGKLLIKPTVYYSDKANGVPVTVLKQNIENVVSKYKGALLIYPAGKSASLINITLNDVNTKRAEDVINTLIQIYNEDAINDKNQIAVSTANFINERLIIISKELGDVDSEIETFKKNNEITDISSETGIYLQAGNEFKSKVLNLENQIYLGQFIRQYLTDPAKEKDLIPANTGIMDVGIESQIGEYNTLLLKRDKLIKNSSNRNPVVLDLNNTLSATKKTIVRSVDNLLTTLDMQYQNIQLQEKQNKRRITSVPTHEKYVSNVARQQKIKEELYLYLLNKREENALNLAITESNARVIDAAFGSKIPIEPKSQQTLLMGGIIGFVIPLGCIFLSVILNTTVRGRKDLENSISVPFLGEIPQKEKSNKQHIVVQENSRDNISEAFRVIRTNMDFMRVKVPDMRVIMLTSSNPKSGKTFISSNLAMSLALTSKKTIIVDIDIRKGTLTKNVLSKASVLTENGLTNYLSGNELSIDAIINKETLHPFLDSIHMGVAPPNPAELLLSTRLDVLITELKKRYDYIIIDNVPADMIADAAIVNRVADLTIYVVREGLMDRRQLPELERMYKENKFKNMAVILNGISTKYNSYNYKYGGYYSSQYNYAYGDDKKKYSFFRKKL